MPLFEKVLSASDAGRIGRLVLPKACAEVGFEVHFLICIFLVCVVPVFKWSSAGGPLSLFFPISFSFISLAVCKLKVNAGIFSSYFSIRRPAFKGSRCEGE